jgi:hypothetical protein
VNHEDLAHFAVSDGLLARVGEHPSGMTDQERHYLADRARETLARALDCPLEQAGRALLAAADQGEVTVQAGREFAVVSAWGRVLVCMNRWELRGICHPEGN